MRIERQGVWIRLAVSRERIQDRSDRRHWRCFIDPSMKEWAIRRCVIRGRATPQNVVTKSRKKRDRRGVVAWLHCFGDIRINAADAAYIALRAPVRSDRRKGS